TRKRTQSPAEHELAARGDWKRVRRVELDVMRSILGKRAEVVGDVGWLVELLRVVDSRGVEVVIVRAGVVSDQARVRIGGLDIEPRPSPGEREDHRIEVADSSIDVARAGLARIRQDVQTTSTDVLDGAAETAVLPGGRHERVG